MGTRSAGGCRSGADPLVLRGEEDRSGHGYRPASVSRPRREPHVCGTPRRGHRRQRERGSRTAGRVVERRVSGHRDLSAAAGRHRDPIPWPSLAQCRSDRRRLSAAASRGDGRGGRCGAPGLGFPAVAPAGLPWAALGVGGTAGWAPRGPGRGSSAPRAHVVGGGLLPRTTPGPSDGGYPTRRRATSPYSRHKAAAERLLDEVEGNHPPLLTVARLRPGIIGQRAAGSALLRYAVPGLLPDRAAPAHSPASPGSAVSRCRSCTPTTWRTPSLRVLDRSAAGAFNLATSPAVTVETIAAALGARSHPRASRGPPEPGCRGLAGPCRRLDPGWIDLAYAVPLLDTTRAETELGWQPRRTAVEVIAEVVLGMTTPAGAASPVLRLRSIRDSVRAALTQGPVHRRRRP